MERSRIILLSVLFLIGFMLWNAWQNEMVKPVAATAQATPAPTSSALPPTQIPHTVAQSAAAMQPNATPVVTKAPAEQLITVTTDVLKVAIDPQGNLVQAHLLKYPQALGDNQPPYQLLNDDPASLYVAQSGLLSKLGPDTEQGQAAYSVQKTNYELAPDQNTLTVDMSWQNKEGIVIHKQFIFNRDDYQVKVQYQIVNNSQQPWSGQMYAQLQRKKPPSPPHGLFSISSYVGAAISSPAAPYKKLSFSKMTDQDLNTQVQGGWEAMLEHYFLSAWIPDGSSTFNYYSRANNDLYTLGMVGKPIVVAPGQQTVANIKLYTGPESMDRLKAVAPNLDLTIDYGVLWFISIAIFWLLKHIYDIIGNWGWAIVVVTLLIKLAFYHLSAKSFRSMAVMRKLQPRMQAIRERYGDDRQKASQATMELYRNEKVNPMSGCLPVIVQIPVFIALYWVLLESVELRQAPFIFWIHDLSIKDPFYVLPVLMGITMYIQQKLNPAPPDPMQAKMMQFLPVFFTFLFLSFPAGLVLYWLVNNTLTILQQWYIMRKMDLDDAKKRDLATVK